MTIPRPVSFSAARATRSAALAFVCVGASLLAPAVSPAEAQDKSLEELYGRIAADLRAGRPLRVRVYVALCDNASQGIVPVKNPSICDGDDPDRNLYWGGGGGLRGYLEKQRWRQLATQRSESDPVLIRSRWGKRYRASGRLRERLVGDVVDVEIEALAYRGREIEQAMRDYLADAHGGADAPAPSHLLGYIGHNVLLDTRESLLPRSARRADHRSPRGVFALSCYGEPTIRPAVASRGASVLLLNRSLTFPGAWTIGGILEAIVDGRDARGIYRAATRHFARGKGRPTKAFWGVFSYGD